MLPSFPLPLRPRFDSACQWQKATHRFGKENEYLDVLASVTGVVSHALTCVLNPGGDVAHVAQCGACVVCQHHCVRACEYSGKRCFCVATAVCGQCHPVCRCRWNRVMSHVHVSRVQDWLSNIKNTARFCVCRERCPQLFPWVLNPGVVVPVWRACSLVGLVNIINFSRSRICCACCPRVLPYISTPGVACGPSLRMASTPQC